MKFKYSYLVKVRFIYNLESGTLTSSNTIVRYCFNIKKAIEEGNKLVEILKSKGIDFNEPHLTSEIRSITNVFSNANQPVILEVELEEVESTDYLKLLDYTTKENIKFNERISKIKTKKSYLI